MTEPNQLPSPCLDYPNPSHRSNWPILREKSSLTHLQTNPPKPYLGTWVHSRNSALVPPPTLGNSSLCVLCALPLSQPPHLSLSLSPFCVCFSSLPPSPSPSLLSLCVLCTFIFSKTWLNAETLHFLPFYSSYLQRISFCNPRQYPEGTPVTSAPKEARVPF